MSDLSSLLDKMLAAGKDYVAKGVAKGQVIAERKLDIPDEPQDRQVMIDGMKKGAIASAVLVGLLGTKTGRNLTGSALKLGSIAALGAVAFKGYKNWQATGDPLSSTSSAVNSSIGANDEARSLLIIEAMVAAANADGHVDSDEIQAIRHELINMHLPDGVATSIASVLDAPASVQELAAKVSNEQMASEVYLATRLIINQSSSPQEQQYLNELVRELAIDASLRAELESQLA